MTDRVEFVRELQHLINKHSLENGSGTPDFVLAVYLDQCLRVFGEVVAQRDRWYGFHTLAGAEAVREEMKKDDHEA